MTKRTKIQVYVPPHLHRFAVLHTSNSVAFLRCACGRVIAGQAVREARYA